MASHHENHQEVDLLGAFPQTPKDSPKKARTGPDDFFGANEAAPEQSQAMAEFMGTNAPPRASKPAKPKKSIKKQNFLTGIAVPGQNEAMDFYESTNEYTLYLSRSKHRMTGGCGMPETEAPLTIGREQGNLLRLNSAAVSRRHAEIVRDRGEFFVRDLGSKNHVYVKNHIIESGILKQLEHGDILSFADQDYYVWIIEK